MVAVFLALAAGPIFADGQHRAFLYPFAGDGVSAERVKELESMVKLVIIRNRTGAFILPDTDSLPASCGPVVSAPPACLARLVRDGVVLRGFVRAAGPRFAVSLSAVDSRGRAFGPVLATVDLATENLRPVVSALDALDVSIQQGRTTAATPQAGVARPLAPPVPPASAALPVPPPTTSSAVNPSAAGAGTQATPSPAPAERPVPPAARTAFRPHYEESPSGAWMAPAGKWLLAGSAAALAGGVVFGYLGRKLNDDLSAKYSSHTLTAADSGSYGTLDKYALGANVLFIAGGVLAATGVTFWALAPDVGGYNGMRVGVSGSF